MLIVDSSVWIDVLRGTANRQSIWLNQAVGQQKIGITGLILCEVLQGARSDAQFRGLRKDLLQFTVFETGTAQLAIASAQNYRALRQKGFTVRKTIDCIIATFCLENGHQLLHNDSDFDAFEAHLGLRVFHPPVVPVN
ncbi:MAG: PIN domain nuclease [Terracidiphilus sp.]|jgi:predicted nucleic acid-binding protein